MGRRVVGCIATAALVFSFAELTTVPVGAQTTGSRPTASNAASQASGSGLQASQRQKSEARSPKPYVPPRTPWGDPDIAGVFTNNDESLTPFERPAQFEGRRLEDITPAELEQLRDQRSDQREEADRNRALQLVVAGERREIDALRRHRVRYRGNDLADFRLAVFVDAARVLDIGRDDRFGDSQWRSETK